MNENITKIYLDMDGVLVNQYKFLASLVNLTEVEFMDKVLNFSTKEEKENFIYPLIIESIKEKGFVLAEPTDFYYTIFEYIPVWISKGIEVEILSSAMSSNTYNEEIVNQKLEWLKLNKLDFLPTNFPLGSKLKQNYAAPNILLIDDFKRNIEEWAAKDSPVILHTSTETTIRILKYYGLM